MADQIISSPQFSPSFGLLFHYYYFDFFLFLFFYLAFIVTHSFPTIVVWFVFTRVSFLSTGRTSFWSFFALFLSFSPSSSSSLLPLLKKKKLLSRSGQCFYDEKFSPNWKPIHLTSSTCNSFSTDIEAH